MSALSALGQRAAASLFGAVILGYDSLLDYVPCCCCCLPRREDLLTLVRPSLKGNTFAKRWRDSVRAHLVRLGLRLGLRLDLELELRLPSGRPRRRRWGRAKAGERDERTAACSLYECVNQRSEILAKTNATFSQRRLAGWPPNHGLSFAPPSPPLLKARIIIIMEWQNN